MRMGETIFWKLHTTSKNFTGCKSLHCIFKTKKNVDKFQIVKEKKGIKNTVSYKL